MLGLGASTQLGIGIAVTLQNRFSGEADKINKSLLAMKKNANNAVVAAMSNYQRTSTMIAAGAGALVYGLYNMAKSGAEFQHRINQAFIVGGVNLGKSRKELADYANDLSGKFATSNTEIAGALFENTKAGITKGLEEITKYQIMAATAAGEQLDGPGGVAQTLLGIMNAMDIHTDHFKDVANGVTGAANATMASVTDIGKAMEYTAFAARLYNVPLAETLAMTGKLSQANIRGSSAGTGLANMFRQLAQTLGPLRSKKSKFAWAALGLDENQMRYLANTGQMYKIVEAISKASKGMTPIKAMGLINPLFNNRGGRAVMGLFDSKSGNKSYSDILKETNQGIAGDVARKQSEAMMNDLWGDFKLLGNAFDRFKAALGKNEIIRAFVGLLTKMVSGFAKLANTPLGGFMVALTAIGASIVTITFAFRAAAMAATLAMNRMAISSAAGTGFGSLLRGGLNMVGLSRFGGAQVMRNRAGALMIKPGTISPWGQKGGQMLSTQMLSNINMNRANTLGIGMGLAGSAGVASKAAGFFSKAGPWIGRIGGTALKAVPILGEILMAVGAISWIYDLLKGEKEEKRQNANDKILMDPMLAEYYQSLDLQMANGAMPGMGRGTSLFNPNSTYQKPGKNLHQQIIVNVDGKRVTDEKIDQNLDGQIDSYLKFNLPE